MAIHHLSVRMVSRSRGRSAVAAAAYRAGTMLTSLRDGVVHDYSGRRSRGEVASTHMLLPNGSGGISELGGEIDEERAALWNGAEAAERRRDACVAREYELALPHELDERGRRVLAMEFGRELVRRYEVAVDVAIHEPSRAGDWRNHHVHYLATTRTVSPDAVFGAKTRVLDDRKTGPAEVEALRELWAIQVNRALERIGSEARVDHRSHARRGLTAIPGEHVGVAAMAMERRAQSEHAERDGGPDVLPPVTDRGRRQVEIVALNAKATSLRGDIAASLAELKELERLAEAERLPEPPRPPVVEEWDADRARWRSLPLGELRQEVERLRPARPEVLAQFAPEVQAERAAVGKALAEVRRASREAERGEAAARQLEREIEDLRAECDASGSGLFARLGSWLSSDGSRRQAALAQRETAWVEERRRQAEAAQAAARHRAEAGAAKARERAAIQAALPAAEAELRPMRARHEAAAAVLRERLAQARAEHQKRAAGALLDMWERANANQRRMRAQEDAEEADRKRREAEERERRRAVREQAAAAAKAGPSEPGDLGGEEDEDSFGRNADRTRP